MGLRSSGLENIASASDTSDFSSSHPSFFFVFLIPPQGKITERSLHDIANRCDGVQTVNMSRRWRGDEVRSDVDTLCGPGTKVVRRGSTRKVKTQTKVKNCRKCANTQTNVVVEEQVTFKQSNGKAVSFKCGKGGSW